MSKKWPLGKIFAFEPFNESYSKLLSVVEKTSNVNCYNVALSDKIGKSNFYVCTNTGANSLLAPKPLISSYLFFDKEPLL